MARMSVNPSFSDLTTIGVGGAISHFLQPQTREELIEAVRAADRAGEPLCVIGGGSNLLVADQPYDGVVIRDTRHAIDALETHISVGGGAEDTVVVRAQAGCHWDDFVSRTIDLGLVGVEGLSGIPGTVGASIVQNIGAYGQEVSSSVESAEVWDRLDGRIVTLNRAQMAFGYRTSLLKRSMTAQDEDSARFFPTPRYIVLTVAFRLHRNDTGTLGYGQLASALHAQVGDRMPTVAIRTAVLAVRAAKGMLEDAQRYGTTAMQGTIDPSNLHKALSAQRLHSTAPGPDYDRRSCGSFFMNPVLTEDQAGGLPEDAPRFDVRSDHGGHAVKTSAAWLIDHAGFHRGYAVREGARASLSTKHTLALTNRGGASAQDVAELAHVIQDGVANSYGIHLVPEPVVVGLALH